MIYYLLYYYFETGAGPATAKAAYRLVSSYDEGGAVSKLEIRLREENKVVNNLKITNCTL